MCKSVAKQVASIFVKGHEEKVTETCSHVSFCSNKCYNCSKIVSQVQEPEMDFSTNLHELLCRNDTILYSLIGGNIKINGCWASHFCGHFTGNVILKVFYWKGTRLGLVLDRLELYQCDESYPHRKLANVPDTRYSW